MEEATTLKSVSRVTHEKKREFLLAFCDCGNISAAAKKVRIARSMHYVWAESDPEYLTAFNEVKQIATDLLEEEAHRRAYTGVLEPVYQGGVKVGSARKFSDTLLIFLLKAHAPEKFRERHDIRHSGQVVTSDMDLSRLSTEQLRLLESILSAAESDTTGQNQTP